MLIQLRVTAELPSQHMADEVNEQKQAFTRPETRDYCRSFGYNTISLFQGLNK